MQFIRYYFILFYIICSCIIANAADRDIDYKNLAFENITNEEGEVPPPVGTIIQDEQGFIWFGTADGLYRYDAYTFDVFQYNPEDTNSLSNNNVKCIIEDREGKIWIGTDYGLSVLNKKTGKFKRFFYEPEDHNSLWYNSINDIVQRKNGEIWIATSKGLNVYDVGKKEMTRVFIDSLVQKGKKYHWIKEGKISFSEFFEDREGNLWIGTWKHGLLKLNREENALYQFNVHQNKHFNRVTSIVEDKKGMLHLGAYYIHHLLFDPEKGKVIDTINPHLSVRTLFKDHNNNIWAAGIDEIYIYSGNNYSCIAHYSAEEGHKSKFKRGCMFDAILQDNTGNIWMSTRREILVHFLDKNNFNKYYHEIGNPQFRDYGKVFFVDKQQHFWYGTFGDGLLLFDENLRLKKRFLKDSKKMTLPGDYIWTLTQDKKDNVWIGTNEGIIMYDPSKEKFIKTIRNSGEKKRYLSHNLIYDIFHDSRGNVWIATQEGLDLMKPDGETIQITEKDGLVNDKVNTIVEDAKGNIWIGTNYGLSCYIPEKKIFKNYVYDPQTSSGLSNQRVSSLIIDSTGYIWIGTDYGLNKFDSEKNTIDYFFKQDGLADNKITKLDIDIQGDLWILTPMGVSRMNINSEKITSFDKNDGLKTNYSGMYINDSLVYIGAKNTGFYSFNINDIKINPFSPPVYITQIKANNKIIQQGFVESSKESLHLKHHESSVEFEFTALNYLFPEKNHFKYKLDGVEEQWNTTSGKRRLAVYNNLRPGKYIFHVKASNNNGIWNKKPVTINVKIFPPWWKTGWAYVLYIFIIAALGYVLFNILKLKREHEQDEMKLNFLTNVAHEYRTPLTLIIDPLEKLINYSKLPESVNNQLKLIFGSAKRMKHLTNQILDLRKLESGKVKPNYQYDDLILFVKNISTSFNFIAQKNNIQFVVNTPYDSFYCYFDSSKLETILFNLLSNAFKYTFKEGHVSINLNINKASDHSDKTKKDTKDQLEINVTNTGERIPVNEIKKIFDRYYQTEQYAHRRFKGTGIGLALVKELVCVLNGTIKVENEPDNKTNFIVKLPLLNKENVSYFNDYKGDNKVLHGSSQEPVSASFKKMRNIGTLRYFQKPIMLIAEDNPEMRTFIVSLFIDKFRIIEAENGKEGYDKTLEHLPDIIISDLVMEGEDGLDFCKNVKNNEKTNHIPFIILTAKTTNYSKLSGYQTGADDYINKPFDSSVLVAKVNNLLNNRALLKDYYHKRFLLNELVDDKIVEKQESANELFIKKVKDIINRNMHDEDFNVEDLLSHFDMSHTHLNRKLKSIIGITARDFIKISRLDKAMHLLKENPDITISEVAYAVGFKEVPNFSRAFKNHYGISPSKIESDS